MTASIRTFVAGIIVPGWGYWIVGRSKHGAGAACLTIALILIFCWTRLVLNPVGLRVLLVFVLTILIGAAVHSALIEVRGGEIERNWKRAFMFAGAYFVIAFLLFSNRGTLLGYEIFRLPASSMAPTLLEGDYIIVDTWRFRDVDPAYGDIVVFELPQSGVNYIKRVVGIPRDEVRYEQHRLTINGSVVPLEPRPDATRLDPRFIERLGDQEHEILITNAGFSIRDGIFNVPDGHYFVLGDNRDNSRDSRYFGMIPRDNIRGRIAHIYYSSSEATGIRWDRFPAQFD
ncbi:MAG: signal peptidase I [Gammaproteobacteria bacterium]|nr:signal peptidase I [Gammaproteobacteria bacterium]